MNKYIPQHDPKYYLQINQASYQEDSQSFLSETGIEADVLEEVPNLHGWKFLLVKHRGSGELTVVFKGTEPEPGKHPFRCLANWGANGLHQLMDPHTLHHQMGEVIDGWAAKHGKITVFTGHSAGGFHATHVSKISNIFRITFNAQKGERGPFNINLATDKDLLSSIKLISVPSRYLVVGHGSHTLNDFECCLKGKSWTDLSSQFVPESLLNGSQEQIQEKVYQFQCLANQMLSRCQSPEEAMRHLEMLKAGSCQLEGELEARQLVTDAQRLRSVLEKEFVSAQRQHRAIALFDCISEIATAFYQADRGVGRFESDFAREPEVRLSLPAMREAVFAAIHPAISMRDKVVEMEQFSQRFCANQKRLVDLLETRKGWRKVANQQWKSLEDLDANIENHYREMIQARSGIVKTLRGLSTGFRIASVVLAKASLITPNPITPITSAAAATVSNVSAAACGIFIGKLDRTQQKFACAMQRSLDTKSILAQTNRRANADIIALESQQDRQVDILLSNPNLFSPLHYREGIIQALNSLPDRIAEKQEAIATRQREWDLWQAQIPGLEEERTRRYGKLSNAKKGDRKYWQEQIDSVVQGLAWRRARQQELDIEIEAFKEEVEGLNDTQNDLIHRQKLEKYVAPVKDVFYEAIQDEIQKFYGSHEETGELRRELERYAIEYQASRGPERRLVQGSFHAFQHVLYASGMEPSGVLSSAAHLGEDLYRLHDHYDHFKVQFDAFKELANQHGGALQAAQEMGPHLFVAGYLIPGLQAIALGIQAFRLVQHIREGCPRSVSREEAEILKLGEELESMGKQMGAQFVHVHRHLDGIQGELMNVLDFVRIELGHLTDEILTEIKQSKREILTEYRTGVTNQFVARMIETGKKMKKRGDKFAAKLETSKHPEPFLFRRLQELVSLLQHNVCLEANAGILRGSTGQPYPVTHEYVLCARFPEHYSGLIGLGAHIQGVPNVHLMIELVEEIVRFLNIPGAKDLKGCDVLIENLFEAYKTFMDLINSFEVIVDRVKAKQDSILHQLHSKLPTVSRHTEQEIIRQSCGDLNALRQHLLDTDFIGKSKFIWTTELVSKRILREENIDPIQIRKDLDGGFFKKRSEDIRRGLVAAAGGGLGGAVVGGVAKIGLGVLALPFMLVTGTVGVTSSLESRVRDLEDLREIKRWYFDGAAFQLNNTYHKRVLGACEQVDEAKKRCRLEIEYWMARDGKLDYCGYLHTRRYPRRRLWLHSRGTPLDDLVKSIFKSRLVIARYQYSYSIMEGSLISAADIARIPDYVVDRDLELESERRLISEYVDWLDHQLNAADLPRRNLFAGMNGESRIIACSTAGHVPLAFPKGFIERIERDISKDREQIELNRIGTLIPTYQFKEDARTGKYSLNIEFRLLSSEKGPLCETYAHYTIATIDTQTVKAFRRPHLMIDEEQPINQDEFLIQAMYSGLIKGLGLPGSDSIAIGPEGKWVAPSECPFPGFYQLWNEMPASSIAFNSDTHLHGKDPRHFRQPPHQCQYNPTQYAHIRREIRRVSEQHKSVLEILQENYDLLWAYLRLVADFDDMTQHDLLERNLGIMDPKEWGRIHHALLLGIDPPPITEEGIQHIESLIKMMPSRPCQHLQSLMQQVSILSRNQVESDI